MKDINRYIDSTLLRPEATENQVTELCEDAKQYEFVSVCVNSSYAGLVSGLLAGSPVKTCVVIGFPLGAVAGEVKVAESLSAISHGATELDMVMNVGALKSRKLRVVEDDIRAVVAAAREKALVKVILECCLLSDDEKAEACNIAVEAGADFVKTSTGFSTGGATVHDVKLMKETVAGRALVKASGGIKDLATALAMIDAGATRIGTSSGVAIVVESERGGSS
jgi:deoxyribose-phosphate aldolase